MNNGWAISVPTRQQTRSETFAQKAHAYGMPTIQADGNDLFASYKACRDMVAHARAGNGPAFVELTTYRLADHTTVDDASRYRTKEEHEAGVASDPLLRMRRYLTKAGRWDDEKEAEAQARAKRIGKEVVKVATEIEPPDPNGMFEHQYETPPKELIVQRDTRHTNGIGQSPRQERLRQPDLAEVALSAVGI